MLLDCVIYCAFYSILFRGPFFPVTVYVWMQVDGEDAEWDDRASIHERHLRCAGTVKVDKLTRQRHQFFFQQLAELRDTADSAMLG